MDRRQRPRDAPEVGSGRRFDREPGCRHKLLHHAGLTGPEFQHERAVRRKKAPGVERDGPIGVQSVIAAIERRAQLSALRGLKGKDRFELDLEESRR